MFALRVGWVEVLCAVAAASLKDVLVRHMACRVTACFRACATLALRGPILSAIARAQSRSRGPPGFLQKMAFAAFGSLRQPSGTCIRAGRHLRPAASIGAHEEPGLPADADRAQDAGPPEGQTGSD